MKGLILSGGHGTRLRPLTHSQQKQLIPVANKPILFYCIEDLINAGIKDIGIIVGPNKEQVIDAVKKRNFKANIEFIHQDYPQGLAHAVKISKDFLGNDKFIMYLGDNMLRGGIKSFVKYFENSTASAKLLLTTVEDPQRYGLALVDEQKKVIIKLVEKPKNPPTNITIVGMYALTPKIFEAIDNINPSWRNELEITDALQWLIENNHNIEYEMVEGWWKDTGRPEDILEANRLVLNDIKSEINGKVKDSKMIGNISLGKDSIINNSTIKGPCIIGNNCKIVNAYIGPFSSIGNNSEITNTEVEDSIIMEGTKITNAEKIIDSLIGKEVYIESQNNLPKGKKIIVGDNSRILI